MARGGREKELFHTALPYSSFFSEFIGKLSLVLFPSKSESMICIFMLDPALLTQSIYMTASTNSHTRLLLRGTHIDTGCTLHV